MILVLSLLFVSCKQEVKPEEKKRESGHYDENKFRQMSLLNDSLVRIVFLSRVIRRFFLLFPSNCIVFVHTIWFNNLAFIHQETAIIVGCPSVFRVDCLSVV